MRTAKKEETKKELFAEEKIAECQRMIKWIFSEDYVWLRENYNALNPDEIDVEGKVVELSGCRFCHYDGGDSSWDEDRVIWRTDNENEALEINHDSVSEYYDDEMLSPEDMFLTVNNTSVNLRSGLIIRNGRTFNVSKKGKPYFNVDIALYHSLDDDNVDDIEFLLKNKKIIMHILLQRIQDRLLLNRLDDNVRNHIISQDEANRLFEKERRSRKLLDVIRSYSA